MGSVNSLAILRGIIFLLNVSSSCWLQKREKLRNSRERHSPKVDAHDLCVARSNQCRVGVACIFKVADDTRQDALALQIMQACKDIFIANGLELFVVSSHERADSLTLSNQADRTCSTAQYPYRVLPNRSGKDGTIGGVIECIPNAQTRDEIGKVRNLCCRDTHTHAMLCCALLRV